MNLLELTVLNNTKQAEIIVERMTIRSFYNQVIEISVVIPTYNRGNYIKKAIDSVLVQEGQESNFKIVEIIVVDDGSSDNTEYILDEIKDDRVRLHKMDQNRGAAVARNKGVRLACGEWIAFQDSDDIWHSDKLKKQVKYLEKNPKADLVSHPIRALFEVGEEVITRYLDTDNYVKALAKKNEIGTPTMLVRKQALEDIGGFDERLCALEDWDFVLRFADQYRIGMIPDVLLDADMVLEGISADASKYYESRCRMIAWNRDILMRHECFDDAVRSLLVHAENNGVFSEVGRMLELYLKS